MPSGWEDTYGFGNTNNTEISDGKATEWSPSGGGFGCNDSGSNGCKPRQRTEWICTLSDCGTRNFGHRTECFKCSEPKGDAVDVASEFTGGSRTRANDWICTNSSCSGRNFGNRSECFKCHEPKGDAEDAPADLNDGPKPRQRTQWTCTSSSCSAKNFGNRTECFKCSEPKGDAVDVPSDSAGASRTRANDWICTNSSCSVKNFGSRTECFKCQEPKGDAEDAPEESDGPKPRQRTEWICLSSNCGANNFGNRTACFKCSEPKGDAVDVPHVSVGGIRPNDWICTHSGCSARNYGSRTECFRCEQPRGDAKDELGAHVPEDKPKESYIPPEADEDEIFTMHIAAGVNFCKLNEIPVTVIGDNIPQPIKSFADAGIQQFVLDNIGRSGYEVPTSIQKNAIPIVSAGRDLMACAQTGSGKTAAFLIPIINALLSDEQELSVGRPHVLIISPTRELVTQIYYEAKKFAAGSYLKCCQIYGGTVSSHQSANLGRGCHILVATPGRLLDFVDRSYIDFRGIRFAVLDEADRMLDMGFQESVEKIMNHPTMVPTGTRQTLMFSATFAEDVKTLAAKYLHEYLFLTIGVVGGACQDVEQIIYEVPKFEKRDKLNEILNAEDPSGTIIFVATKRTADFLATLLSESSHPTTSIHGDRLQSQREQSLRDFKSRKMKILIATSVAARGLDIPNVNHVINYDLPKEIDDYVHRIGRTGRVGNKGKATSFYEPEQDSQIAGDLIKILQGAGQTVPDFLTHSGATSQDFGGNDGVEELW
ncbi:ATP-dependent RNA helicase vasa [Pseudolycoriella hygida]|uniref:RNA helicase n=1 Tax=Pseudolycoriella hygida TaxID=35572 RepID=A0A9Q0N3S0_9DIPT|nr:ATP-dependent RNA helicase vasa [Pseudolycoriella hygida]